MLFEKKIVSLFSQNLIHRYDGDAAVFYYTYSDFEGLSTERFTFPSNRGDTLVGAFYYYGKKRRDRILVFDHGMGGGHTAYMKEIELLCRAGYTVFSYDKSGCMESEGESIYSFSQSIADLDACLKALKSRSELEGATFSVIGHSWGAYATMNIAAFHPDVTHLVSFAGPVSARAMFSAFLPGILSLYLPAMMKNEYEKNPDYADASAHNALADYRGKALIIQSDDDKTVSMKKHFLPLKKALSHKDTITFYAVSGKNHNPNYTADAVAYLTDYSTALAKARKEGTLQKEDDKIAFKSRYDFDRMTKQDDALWQKVLAFLA